MNQIENSSVSLYSSNAQLEKTKMKECLLIDDDMDDQEIFKICVEKITRDINFKGLTDSVNAISTLTTNSGYTPDYIFLDVNMPKINGMQCLAVLRQIERLNSCKIFMYSTTSDEEMVAKSKKQGADDFIIKPARAAELKEKLIRIFGIQETK